MDTDPQLVLAIDDNEDARVLLRIVLKRAGYRVNLGEDGQDGLNKFAAQRPDLVIVDLMMPGISGKEVIAKIRAESPSTPILAYTAMDSPKDRNEALAAGANEVLVKAADRTHLLRAVQAHMPDAFQAQTPSEG
jgi:two-component system response regulator MprA